MTLMYDPSCRRKSVPMDLNDSTEIVTSERVRTRAIEMDMVNNLPRILEPREGSIIYSFSWTGGLSKPAVFAPPGLGVGRAGTRYFVYMPQPTTIASTSVT